MLTSFSSICCILQKQLGWMKLGSWGKMFRSKKNKTKVSMFVCSKPGQLNYELPCRSAHPVGTWVSPPALISVAKWEATYAFTNPFCLFSYPLRKHWHSLPWGSASDFQKTCDEIWFINRYKDSYASFMTSLTHFVEIMPLGIWQFEKICSRGYITNLFMITTLEMTSVDFVGWSTVRHASLVQ